MKTLIIFLPPILWMLGCYAFIGKSPAGTRGEKKPKKLQQWDIVCSSDGRYNFVDDIAGNPKVFMLHDFPTKAEAEQMRNAFKRMHDADQEERKQPTPEKIAAQKRVAATKWEACQGAELKP